MDSHEQRRRRQHTLLEHAASHGPYLWSSRDIENALLWFPSASSAAAFAPSSVAAPPRPGPTDDARSDDADERDDAGCEFLRRLLHSPGTRLPRFAPMKRSSSSRGGRGGDAPGLGRAFDSRDAKAGKKRKREPAETRVSSVRNGGESGDILPTVLKGYYRLFLPRRVASSAAETDDIILDPKTREDRNDGTDDDATRARHSNEKADTDTEESSQAEMASSRLRHDLNSIILSRLRNHELYKAAIHQYSKTSEQNTLDRAPKELQMNILIDQYMTHPTTSILRAYTSTLFDRHTSLLRQNQDNKPFLRKILGLTRGNEKIQQVVILFLLEPLRRLFVKKLEGRYCEKEETVRSSCRARHDSADERSTTEEMTSKISPFPLLTASVPWSDIPHEEIEKECSRNPMPEIIEFVLQSASAPHRNKPKHDKDWISWWTLPSPLLCAASQMYFPLACVYLRHWIEAAIVAHGNLYRLGPTANDDVNRPQSQVWDVKNDGMSFESAVLRIRQIRRTSDRLESLFYYVFAHIENEAQGSCQKKTIMGHCDEDESTVSAEDILFRQRLAWDAIKRAVEE